MASGSWGLEAKEEAERCHLVARRDRRLGFIPGDLGIGVTWSVVIGGGDSGDGRGGKGPLPPARFLPRVTGSGCSRRMLAVIIIAVIVVAIAVIRVFAGAESS